MPASGSLRLRKTVSTVLLVAAGLALALALFALEEGAGPLLVAEALAVCAACLVAYYFVAIAPNLDARSKDRD